MKLKSLEGTGHYSLMKNQYENFWIQKSTRFSEGKSLQCVCLWEVLGHPGAKNSEQAKNKHRHFCVLSLTEEQSQFLILSHP